MNKTGTAAANKLTGTNAADKLFGLGGNDQLFGLGGVDALDGSTGNDTLDGGAGNDKLIGGTGNDTYIVTATSGTDQFLEKAANGGTDTIVSSRSSFTLGTPTATANHIENLTLTGSAITGIGNSLNNVIKGTTGNNKLSGAAGNDTLDGGAGNDSLNGGAGGDSMKGGAGNDTYVVDALGDKVVGEAAGGGTDLVQSSITFTLGGTGLSQVENLTLTGTGNTNGTGNALANTIIGNAHNNVLNGGTGAAADKLDGGAGNDTLDGAGGADSVVGGAGNDTLIYDAADVKLDGGANTDTLRPTGNGTIDLTLASDTMIGGIEIVDLAGNNTLKLVAGDVTAMGGAVTVEGGAGDVVLAGAGWAQLAGNDGHAVYGQGGATLAVDLDIDRAGITVGSMSLGLLDGANGFRIAGSAPSQKLGQTVSDAGDVNGDGYGDVIVGAPELLDGAAFVVFGAASGFEASLDVSALDGANGFKLTGEPGMDGTGWSVSAAGDVNGDGYGDLLVGAPTGGYAGGAYIVYGTSSFASTLSLAGLDGTTGFQMSGEELGARAGSSVSAAGDVNGDGYDDVIIGAYKLDSSNGAAYLVFGTKNGIASNLQLSALDGTIGLQLSGSGAEGAGWSVAGAGDLNGDGFDDLLVGAIYADPNAVENAGVTYVVLGHGGPFTPNLDLSALSGSNGFRLVDSQYHGYSGYSVSAAGDFNGDGIADLIVGASSDPNGYAPRSGASFVVFGEAAHALSSLDLSALSGSNGFRLSGSETNGHAGFTVSAAGDVNGDGYDDLIVGASLEDPGGLINSGASYVVFGAASGYGAGFDLSSLDGQHGFRLEGEAAYDSAAVVSAAGDVNGDGFADLIIGARLADAGADDAGAGYVVFGRDWNDVVDFLGGIGSDTIVGSATADVMVGGQGDDRLSGGGGADVFRGGAGDDLIVLGDGGFFDIDGGLGEDTLALGAGVDLDLVALGDARLGGIEIVELGAGGANTLTLDAHEVLALSDTTNTLRVSGGADDTVRGGGEWTLGEDTTIGDDTYSTYTRGGATLLIDTDVNAESIDVLSVPVPVFSLASLDGGNGFRIEGYAPVEGDHTGRIVGSAGDVNGDGLDDLLVTGKLSASKEGAVYVVYGRDDGFAPTLDVTALDGDNGFRLVGIDGSDFAGFPLHFWGNPASGAGDVNNDGYADLVIGAEGGDAGGTGSGEIYVVFGGSDLASSIALSGLTGANGFRIDGIAAGDEAGVSVSTAGDVNRDGYDDLVIGAAERDANDTDSGESYVVFGASAFGATLSLSGLNGGNGFHMTGAAAGDKSGISVSDAGDVNGDGTDDFIIGANYGDIGGGNAGQSYVVFGTGGFASAVALTALNGATGFRMVGAGAGDYSGLPVSAAGDVNGDGLGDLLVGAYYGPTRPGSTYLVFGRTTFSSSLSLSALNGTDGFRLDGIANSDQAGTALSAAGDVNGDGYDDFIIGANSAGTFNEGGSYIVFGGSSFGPLLPLSALDGINGFQVPGAGANDQSGRSVSGGGDVNGDGYDDVIIGSGYHNGTAGESYVIFGGDLTNAVDFKGTSGNDTLTGAGADEVFVGGRGNDLLDGGGGADVFRGGAGDDRIVVADAGFADVDGGAGEDTLAVSGALDLTAILDAEIGGIEIVDLVAGAGAETLTFALTDVLALSDTTNTLTVNGDGDDAVVNSDVFWAGGDLSGGYHVFTFGGATLRVQDGIDVSGLQVIS